MKSKKANEYVIDNLAQVDCGENNTMFMLHCVKVKKVIEIAEEEMMDKALEAHTLTCGFRIDNKCRLSDFHTECRLINNCAYKLDFTAKLNEQ